MADAGIETELVTIRKYEVAAKAHLARGRLEAEGIDAAITDEHLADYNMFYGRTMGGVRLLVRAEDAERATVALGEIMEPDPDEEATSCPACGSGRTRHGLASQYLVVQFLMVLLLMVTGVPFARWRWRCDDCGARWRSSAPSEGDDA